jgi:histone H3/H4
LARIKKVMKADPEVKMISAEAPILFAKGCDIFITELTMRAWIHAEENKRRTLQRSDIASALSKSDMFDFLIDIVPREEAHPHKRSGAAAAVQSSAAQVPPGGLPQQVHPQHQMPPPDYGMSQHMPQQEDFRQPNMYAGAVQGDPGAYGQQHMFDQGVYGGYPMQQPVSRWMRVLVHSCLYRTRLNSNRCIPLASEDLTQLELETTRATGLMPRRMPMLKASGKTLGLDACWLLQGERRAESGERTVVLMCALERARIMLGAYVSSARCRYGLGLV